MRISSFRLSLRSTSLLVPGSSYPPRSAWWTCRHQPSPDPGRVAPDRTQQRTDRQAGRAGGRQFSGSGAASLERGARGAEVKGAGWSRGAISGPGTGITTCFPCHRMPRLCEAAVSILPGRCPFWSVLQAPEQVEEDAADRPAQRRVPRFLRQATESEVHGPEAARIDDLPLPAMPA